MKLECDPSGAQSRPASWVRSTASGRGVGGLSSRNRTEREGGGVQLLCGVSRVSDGPILLIRTGPTARLTHSSKAVIRPRQASASRCEAEAAGCLSHRALHGVRKLPRGREQPAENAGLAGAWTSREARGPERSSRGGLSAVRFRWRGPAAPMEWAWRRRGRTSLCGDGWSPARILSGASSNRTIACRTCRLFARSFGLTPSSCRLAATSPSPLRSCASSIAGSPCFQLGPL